MPPPALLEVGDATEGLAVVEDRGEILVLLCLLVRDRVVVPCEVAAVGRRSLRARRSHGRCGIEPSSA